MPEIDSKVWLAWVIYMFLGFVVGIAWFGVAEGIAIVNNRPGDTLTEVVRSLNVPAVVWFLSAGLILGLLGGLFAWLVPHFIGRFGI